MAKVNTILLIGSCDNASQGIVSNDVEGWVAAGHSARVVGEHVPPPLPPPAGVPYHRGRRMSHFVTLIQKPLRIVFKPLSPSHARFILPETGSPRHGPAGLALRGPLALLSPYLRAIRLSGSSAWNCASS
jgi:hypothetical protein